MSRRRSAFTLVELLVVIGIIAVLIGILLPTLAKARNNAARIKCAAQLREVGTATAAYAVENKGYLPPAHGDRGQWDFQYTHNAMFYHSWHTMGKNARIDFDPKDMADNGAQIGRLIRRKHLTNPQMYYCPSHTRNRRLGEGNDGDGEHTMNYYYNVHPAYNPKLTSPEKEVIWWKKLHQYGRPPMSKVPVQWGGGGGGQPAPPGNLYQFPRIRYALATDPIRGLTAATHANGHQRSWNLLAADGSVKTAVVDSRKSTREGAGNWPRFLDVLGVLERVADGVPAPETYNGPYNCYMIVGN